MSIRNTVCPPYWNTITVIIFLCCSLPSFAQQFYTLQSPDKHLKVKISINDSIHWQLAKDTETLLFDGVTAMQIINKATIGYREISKEANTKTVSQTITATIAVRSKYIEDHYNELSLLFKSGNKIVFRVFNNGVAYHWLTSFDDSLEISNEIVRFRFPQDNSVFWGSDKENNQYQSHYEQMFKDTVLSAYGTSQFCSLPLYIATANTKLLLTEADLLDYPNLFLHGTSGNALSGGFPKVIVQSEQVRDRGIRVLQNAPYIAKTNGKRSFPWRLVMVANQDKELLQNNLVYQLASPNRIKETSWIKPGKVSWDWWNSNNIYGVNFKSGINNATYKYNIDFAAKYHLQYIILDEGWSRSTSDLTHARDEIDIPELVDYGKARGIGVILWALWQPLDRDMDKVLDTFVRWGVKGIKVDFMARADQYMVNFYERLAQQSAERKLIVDLHGAYKPVGLNRTYPNIISYEGVKGLENYKWSGEEANPTHDVVIPFTRMVVGPMDYTPGAIHNATKKDFRIVYNEPMSEGTRAHQVAMYAIYESPLQMLADNPSSYYQDSITTKFICAFPTTWDSSVVIDGKIGEYVIVARKQDNKWYVGALTNWSSRELSFQLNFLKNDKHYLLSYYSDGINADRHAGDYLTGQKDVKKGDNCIISMQPGGGWAAVFIEK